MTRPCTPRRCAALPCRSGGRGASTAAASWEALLATRGVPAHLRREAREALAIYQEHRARDFGAAQAPLFWRRSPAGRWRGVTARVPNGVARLDRKLVGRTAGRLIPGLDEEPF